MRKGEIRIRKFQLIFYVIILLIIGGCTESSSKSKDEIIRFPNKQNALEHFIEDKNIKGKIDLVTTTNNDQLLVTQVSENTYFIGELKEDDEGFYVGKITADVHMENGAAWELITMGDNEYTIYFEKTDEKPNFIKLSSGEYFISIVEGHTLSENLLNATNGTNVIKERSPLIR